MYRIFLLIPLMIGCTHETRIERLEHEVRDLKEKLSDLETDWALFQTTPDGHWIYPRKRPTDAKEQKNERRAKR